MPYCKANPLAKSGDKAMTLAPFVMYIAFLSYYLTLDILTAVLKLPEKLDKIAEK